MMKRFDSLSGNRIVPFLVLQALTASGPGIVLLLPYNQAYCQGFSSYKIEY